MARRKARYPCLAGVLVFAAACATRPLPQAPPSPPPPAPVLRPIAPGAIAPVPIAPGPAIVPPSSVAVPGPLAMELPPPTDAQSLRARYGTPDFIRRETDSELWRYDGQNCAIFFFLYRDGDILKLRYSETNPRGMDMAADPKCVQGLTGRAGSMF